MALLFFVGQSATYGADEDRLAGVKSKLRAEYQEVNHLPIDAYLDEYQDALLVDVRKDEEFAVSRIPGAVHAGTEADLLRLAEANPGKQLVLYCSVGRRSSAAARFLIEQGVEADQVSNLEGSIFEWANAGRPLENAQGQTGKVHPYNAFWGWRYLSREVRSRED